ncbi:uncharacterized protein BKA78DRAFT_310848 [Phyllosticta capitalensis]|uniref:uncharacterized protein n=1 Tax=Phyllosticta capitalensis TaxID=121624 RepID=UPI00312FD9FA
MGRHHHHHRPWVGLMNGVCVLLFVSNLRIVRSALFSDSGWLNPSTVTSALTLATAHGHGSENRRIPSVFSWSSVKIGIYFAWLDLSAWYHPLHCALRKLRGKFRRRAGLSLLGACVGAC